MTVESLRPATTLPGEKARPGAGPDLDRRPRPASLADRLAERRWLVVAFLVVVFLGSLVLRTRSLNVYYWVDEAISVGIASHHLSALPHLLREDGSPPLYYLMLHGWMQLFGSGEVATHVLSLVFAMIAVPLSYWAGASLYGRRTGVCAFVLMAFVPFMTSYAQETRMYSLMGVWSLLVAASFAHVFVRRDRRYLPLFVISLAGALYTHNWALYLALGSVFAFAACWWREPELRRALLKDGAIALAAVLVLYSPWLPTFLYQARHTGAPWANLTDLWSLTEGMYFIVGGRGPAVAILLGAGVGIATLRHVSRQWSAEVRTTIALLVLGGATLLIAWLYAKHTPSWAPRYLAVVLGPLLLAAAFGLVRAGWLGFGAVLVCCMLWVTAPPQPTRAAKSNLALDAMAVSHHVGAHPLVLSTQPEQVPDVKHYLPAADLFFTPLGRVADDRVVDWRNALPKFERSTVANTLEPALRALRPGQRLVIVTPSRYQKTPRWMSLIRRSTIDWLAYLQHDRHLRQIESVAPDGAYAGLEIRFTVFEQVRGR